MDKLLEILKEMKPGVDFEHEANLVDSGILDSLSIVMLVSRLRDEFDVEITPLDLVPENFESVQTIYELINRLDD